MVAWYPGASVAPHPPTSITPPPTRITFEQEAAIRAWLASIGETDPALIADTMNLANRDAVARGYLLERAESARETSRDCRDCASYPPTTARTARHSSDADGGAVRLTR
ncbi:hypothetical protein FACS189488_15150 [Betaproteobacteria bacterium]|nr:hypothetical protein FACS189488_15150 [Betaproteobacteria bacterium]